MEKQALEKFILKHESLFWYTPAKELRNISNELLLETILNYGDLKTILECFKIMGVKKAKLVFNSITGRKKGNLYPEIYHLFSEYFKQVA